MVTGRLGGLVQHVTTYIRADIQEFLASINYQDNINHGLFTYRIEGGDRKRRIHLRIQPDSSGILFFDVTDVIYLNKSAARMAKMALDGIPLRLAKTHLSAAYLGLDSTPLDRELEQIYTLIDHFYHHESGCPTCNIPGLNQTPLFSKRALSPFKVDLALTYGCNNQCGHCYNEPDRFDMPSLSKRNWQQVIDILYHQGVPHLIFTGGEATLHPDLLDLIHYADQLGMIVGLNTNGRRLAHAPYVHALAAAGLNHVQITLGSHQPELHDQIMGARSFRQTVHGIQNAVNSSIHCITNTTLMRCNRDHVEEIIDFLYDLGIRMFAMNGMIYSGGGLNDPNAIPEEEMPPLLIRIRDHAHSKHMRFLWYTPTEYCRMSPVELELGAKRCNAGEYSICVEPNGDVLPCQSYYTAAGNILKDSWDSIWQGDLFTSFRLRDANPRQAGLPQKCWDCPDLPLCGGGCRLEREARPINLSKINLMGPV